MATVTLAQLRTRTLEAADYVGNPSVTTSMLDTFINNGKRELDDVLVRNYGEEYAATSVTFLTTSGQEAYSLSTLTSGTFYKLLSLSSNGPNGWDEALQYNRRERNALRSNGVTALNGGKYRYRITGDNLSILPVTTTAVRFEVEWVPQTVALSSTTDSFNDGNGWSELVVLSAAIAILDAKQEDASALRERKAVVMARIMANAPNRDTGQPATVVDVHTIDPRFPWLGYPR